MEQHQITTLPNGLRVVSQLMPDVQTVSMSVWVGTGSRYENVEENGISHFLEHMAFKGTKRRNALDIAKEFDLIGGHFNAYTSREHTVYYAKTLKDHVNIAIDILADILQHSVFDKEEIERERGVVLQEIAQAYDTPDDIIFDYYQSAAFHNQPLGYSILGPVERVESFQRDDLVRYIDKHYHTRNMVVSAAGNIEHDAFVAMVAEQFNVLREGNRSSKEKGVYKGGEIKVRRDLEQVHFLLGFQGISYHTDTIYTLNMLTNILGGGMSSRLFQEVREKRGLAYAVSSFFSAYDDTGLFTVYAGTGERDLPELADVIIEELYKMTEQVSEEELTRARSQTKASILMAQESSTHRAETLGRHFLHYGRYIPMEETLSKIAAITPTDISRLMKKIISDSPPTVAAIGKLDLLPEYGGIVKRLGR